MVETYSFIFWAHSGGLSAADYSNIICHISDLLDQYFGKSIINYKTAYSKQAVKPIKMSHDFMLHEIETARQKRKNNIPLEFSYFSSFDDEWSFGVQLSFDDLLFSSTMLNCFIIRFPIVCLQLKDDLDGLWQLFKAIVKEIKPFFAFMPNLLDERLSDVYWTTKPTYVHTFNYYANDTIELIGNRRLLRERNIEQTENGIFLKLLDEPLSIHNSSHLLIQEEVSKRLGLI